MTKIIAKYVCGRRTTHNGDGSYTLAWRLWSDGRVERTNSRSKYQTYFTDERIPEAIIKAAMDAGIAIQAGRERSTPAVERARKAAMARKIHAGGRKPVPTACPKCGRQWETARLAQACRHASPSP